jgi:ribosome-associated translation inhibitor RaiA
MIELGGNIKLIGFNELDSASLIVVKKITGNYARKISEKVNSSVDELSLELKSSDAQKGINSSLKIKDKEIKAEVSDVNLFYALDKALSKLLKEV